MSAPTRSQKLHQQLPAETVDPVTACSASESLQPRREGLYRIPANHDTAVELSLYGYAGILRAE
jgi:hypothetical protein